MSKMITLISIFAAVCLASAAPYQSGEDTYHQTLDYQGQGQAQHHLIDFQQHLQQNQAQELQGHQQQPVQVFQHQGFQQNHNDVNHGIGHSQVHNTQGDAKILNYQLDTDEHGNYQYAYETDNGIRAQEVGSNTDDGVKMQGAYSYTGDDGQVYTVTYTADENGFHPSGAHLPTPPPVPEAIARSIEKNLQDEANGINDDGQNQQNQQSGQYNHQSEQFAHQAGQYTQQSEQYTQQSEQKPQISIAPKKYRPNIQVKDINQQPTHVQRPQQQIVVKQPRRQNNPQQIQKEFVQQAHHQTVQQTQHRVVHQPQHQVTVQRPQHISFNSQQHQLQLQSHEPTKYVVKHNPHYQQHASASHDQISQTALHQQSLDSSHNFQGGFVPKYEVTEHQIGVQEPSVQKQHIIEYHLPAAQNTVTEERHKVEYIVPSMKQFLDQFKPDKQREVIYQVTVPTVTQHKLAQEYIGPAPVVDYQHYH